MNKQVLSDQDLVRSFQKGNSQALETLIYRYQDRIYSTIYLLVRDSALAEDIFQDTFVKVIKTLQSGTYYEDGKFLPWVLRIARNLSIDYFRRKKRAPFVREPEEYDLWEVLKVSEENGETGLVRRQSHEMLRKLIDRLPQEQKEVLVMRHYGELSFKEIAELTHVSINTALGRMRYALNNLRKMMTENKLSL